MDKTSLGDRMKGYERSELRMLTYRAPLIIRIDGCHFHSFTKGFDRPFDISFLNCMRETAKALCNNIMGAKVAYTQSDEISLLLTDDDTLETQPWFGKNLQKIVSVSAAMATYYFNKAVEDAFSYNTSSAGLTSAVVFERTAYFDSRAFLLPREEVNNYFEWRQQDCIRNSIQAVGQTYFSQKELSHKSCNDIKDMLLAQKGINWDEYPTDLKRGVCISKMFAPDNRMKWAIDKNIPIFHENPDYINRLVYHE